MSYLEIDDLTGSDACRDAAAHQVLLAMRAEPERSWTVAELSARVHLSRAAMARRFTKAYGKAPIAMLTLIRLEMAAEILCSTSRPLDLIANHVGYSNAFALSSAFKREFGLSPRDYRRHCCSNRAGSGTAADTGQCRSGAAGVSGGAAVGGDGGGVFGPGVFGVAAAEVGADLGPAGAPEGGEVGGYGYRTLGG